MTFRNKKKYTLFLTCVLHRGFKFDWLDLAFAYKQFEQTSQ
ncbi:hypothetical protein [Clostridium beijerinckii]|nr:hypothetical protein [Clostridium beijerinckii]